MQIFEPLFRSLNEAAARYVVVGGVATVLHGFARLTADVDLIVDLDPKETRKVLDVLTATGFTPRAPVVADGFADPAIREEWIQTKNMEVFSLVDRNNPLRVVDLLAKSPIDFDSLWERSKLVELEATTVRIASIDDLIRLKTISARPEDKIDIEQLERIRDRNESADG